VPPVLIPGPTVFEKVDIPDELLEPCPEPDLSELKTNKDLEIAAIEAVASLASCNEDKADIKAWETE